MEGKNIEKGLLHRPEVKIGGPYVASRLNPPSSEFQDMLHSSRRSILDIGCMGKYYPRCSWGLKRGDIWVGCDPLISTSTVQRGLGIEDGAKLAVFSSRAGEVPQFHPDFLSAVAPDPSNIGEIFNDELTRFLDRRKRQVFMVALDTQSHEASGYLGQPGFFSEAKAIVTNWMKKNKFELDERYYPGNFSLNSDNLGGRNVVGCWVRNG